MTPDCSKVLRRMAVPPPQQKFLPFSLSMVTSGAFHAASSALGRLLRIGSSQRMVVVAPILTSPSGDTRWCSQRLPGQPSESVKTRTSNSGGSCSTATRRLFTFSPELAGFPAMITLAFTLEFLATRSTMLRAGSEAEARMKKIS